MGKVGSSTIYNSLEKMYGEERVLHTHNHEMAKEYIEKWKQKIYQKTPKVDFTFLYGGEGLKERK